VPRLLDMGCVFSNVRMGHEVAVPRTVAARAMAAFADAAAEAADDRWQRELAAWLAEQARALANGGDGVDIGDLAWSPANFVDQQRFALSALADAAAAHTGELRSALDRLAALVAGHDRSWVVVGRRWTWLDRAPSLP
jgi:hypothetical protein